MSQLRKWLNFNHKNAVPVVHSNEYLLWPFHNFQQEFDKLFQNFYQSLPSSITDYNNLNIIPLADIVEDENNFNIEIEMPGVDENDIKVAINNNKLVIKASKKVSRKNEGKNYSMREISYGSYERNIQLPDNVDVDQAESTFKKGMLWVNLPKKAIDKSKLRDLEIKKG